MLATHIAQDAIRALIAGHHPSTSWLDPVIALGIAALAVHEGRQVWEGEGCACATVPGLDGANDACQDDCCV